MTQLATQLIASNQENQNHWGNNGNGGTNGHNRGNNGVGGTNGNTRNHAEGGNNHIPTQVGTRTIGRIIPKPLMPRFMGNQKTENQGWEGQGETFDYYWREYQDLGEDF